MTNLDLTEVIPAKRSAEPGPVSRGLYISISYPLRDLGSPAPGLRYATPGVTIEGLSQSRTAPFPGPSIVSSRGFVCLALRGP